jgi:hypothetical protein
METTILPPQISVSFNKETQTQYKSVITGITGHSWGIVQAKGKFNYVHVTRINHNPFGSSCVGKYFADFPEAIAHYKYSDMKAKLAEISEWFNN